MKIPFFPEDQIEQFLVKAGFTKITRFFLPGFLQGGYVMRNE